VKNKIEYSTVCECWPCRPLPWPSCILKRHVSGFWLLSLSFLLHVTVYETNIHMVQLSTLKNLIELQDFLGIFHSWFLNHWWKGKILHIAHSGLFLYSDRKNVRRPAGYKIPGWRMKSPLPPRSVIPEVSWTFSRSLKIFQKLSRSPEISWKFSRRFPITKVSNMWLFMVICRIL